MANALIAYNNRVDGATLSGGSWLSGLPLNNLKDRQIGKVARSASALTTATQFDTDIGEDKTTRVIALIGHNLSLDATIRIRGGNDPAFATTDIDTGWLEVWPAVYPSETLDWEASNFWSGKYLAEEISGYTLTHVDDLGAVYRSRYWRIEINDPTNSSGYVQIGRAFFGQAWQPSINLLAGASIGWEPNTQVQSALSGGEFFKRYNPTRVARFTTRHTEDEGMANAFEIQRRMGIDGEVVFVWNPDDTVHSIRRRFVGRLRSLSQLEFPWVDRTQTGWEIKELVR